MDRSMELFRSLVVLSQGLAYIPSHGRKNKGDAAWREFCEGAVIRCIWREFTYCWRAYCDI